MGEIVKMLCQELDTYIYIYIYVYDALESHGENCGWDDPGDDSH